MASFASFSGFSIFTNVFLMKLNKNMSEDMYFRVDEKKKFPVILVV